MALTNAGVTAIANAIIGKGTFFDNANAYIGVGNGTAVFAAGQTDLQGSSKLRKGMSGTSYPSISGNNITFAANFNTSEANFAWNEWGIFNAASGGTMLNRVVESNGTKQENQTWVMTVTITFGVGD